jgi:hypothetical protein
MEPNSWEIDITGIKASYGVDPEATDSLTYRELQARREKMRDQFAGHDNPLRTKSRRHRPRRSPKH